ncbi:MAG: hypothetical protein LBO74_16925 [Candidatus Symbiothrix sp.]|nr:hypothetical protein [Candidatus Symbiothrix sp.]
MMLIINKKLNYYLIVINEVLDLEIEGTKLDIPAVKPKNNKKLSLEDMIMIDNDKKQKFE